MCLFLFRTSTKETKHCWKFQTSVFILFESAGASFCLCLSIYLFIALSLFCWADNRVVTTLIAFAYPYFRKCISSDSEVSSFCSWRHSNPGRIPIPFTPQHDLIRENLIAWIIASRAREILFVFIPFPQRKCGKYKECLSCFA